MNSSQSGSLREQFESPLEVARSNELSREQKLKILRRWREDELALQVAADENMAPLAGGSDQPESLLGLVGKVLTAVLEGRPLDEDELAQGLLRRPELD